MNNSINTELKCLFAGWLVAERCAISKRSWVQFPVTAKHFNNSVALKIKKPVKEREDLMSKRRLKKNL